MTQTPTRSATLAAATSLLLAATSSLGGLRAQTPTALPYTEGFETGDGGYTTGGANTSWNVGIPQGPAFITAPASGFRAWVTNLAGSTNNNEDSFLESPEFDFTNLVDDPFLEFAHIFNLGFSSSSLVEIAIADGPFTRLGSPTDPETLNWYNQLPGSWTDLSGAAGEWRTARRQLDGAAGNTIRLRWRLTTSTFSNSEGVGVDDILIFESRNDIAITSIELAASSPTLGSAEPLAIAVTNNGTTPASGFMIQTDVTGPLGSTTTTETFASVLGPTESLTIAIAAPVDLSTPGSYEITASVLQTGDEASDNNSLTTTRVRQDVITTFPYLETFENGDGGYIGGGEASSWEVGEPAATFLNSAATGDRAWVTNLSGLPNDGEVSYLQSPLLDLTGFDQDPFVSFDHRFELDFSDTHALEISIDGNAFSRLGSRDDPASQNWYGFSNDWDGNSSFDGSWRRAEHLIDGGAGRMVQLRWVFRRGSIFGAGREGVGVDTVRIFEAPLGNGQPPLPNQATLDINDAREVLGIPVSFGAPGPYFSSASVSTDTFDLSFSGTSNEPVVLLAGTLSVGALPFQGGQIDIMDPAILLSGFAPGGINPFFVTNPSGSLTLSLSIPLGLVSQRLTFQTLSLDEGCPSGICASNAVQVTFLP